MAPKLSSAKPNPPQMWRRSESPEETWDGDGANSDGEWPLRIVGEEVDYWGDVRFEVEWDSWKRKDGTNNTWKDFYVADGDHLRNVWKKRQNIRRKKLAKESVDIELHPGLDIHNNHTRLRAQAFEEKLRLAEREPCMWAEDRLKFIAESEHVMHGRRSADEGDSPGRRLRSASVFSLSQRGSSTAIGAPNSGTASRTSSHAQAPHRQPVLTPTSSSATLASESPRHRSAALSYASTRLSQEIPIYDGFENKVMSEKARGKQRALDLFSPTPPPSAGSRSGLVPLPTRGPSSKITKKSPSRRKTLTAQWSKCAPITFHNDVDDEEVPPLPVDFEYIEKGYVFDPSIPNHENMKYYLLACSGHSVCSQDMGDCECQKADEHQERPCAYDKRGRFTFSVHRGEEVLECTPLCHCGVNCKNRVVQRDRDVPLEIFKTISHGWGVRAKVDLKRGKVLGMYTGLLLPRGKAVKMRTKYCFDLDGHEQIMAPDDREDNDGYSVDSSSMGNWSRFVNHSCDGNLHIYEVVYDLPPGAKMPYIAYAALRDIPAGEELMFDYQPKHAEDFSERPTKYKKTAGGKRIPAGCEECRCGSSNCRGYI